MVAASKIGFIAIVYLMHVCDTRSARVQSVASSEQREGRRENSGERLEMRWNRRKGVRNVTGTQAEPKMAEKQTRLIY